MARGQHLHPIGFDPGLLPCVAELGEVVPKPPRQDRGEADEERQEHRVQIVYQSERIICPVSRVVGLVGWDAQVFCLADSRRDCAIPKTRPAPPPVSLGRVPSSIARPTGSARERPAHHPGGPRVPREALFSWPVHVLVGFSPSRRAGVAGTHTSNFVASAKLGLSPSQLPWPLVKVRVRVSPGWAWPSRRACWRHPRQACT